MNCKFTKSQIWVQHHPLTPNYRGWAIQWDSSASIKRPWLARNCDQNGCGMFRGATKEEAQKKVDAWILEQETKKAVATANLTTIV